MEKVTLMNQENLRWWATRNDSTSNFYQFLMGNRTFEECAMDAIESLEKELLECDRNVFAVRIVDQIIPIAGQLPGNDELMNLLGELRDSLTERFFVPTPPKAVEPPQTVEPPVVVKSPPPTKVSSKIKAIQVADECDVLSMMGK
jgi:hypothetical protein